MHYDDFSRSWRDTDWMFEVFRANDASPGVSLSPFIPLFVPVPIDV